MAYSDYGGYAYRNGVRVIERSDACLTTEGLKSTPGIWPGWSLTEGREGNSYHVILGDGPIHVALYKQSHIAVFKDRQNVPLPESFVEANPPKDLSFEIDGHKLTVHQEETDNYYQYVRLEQPNGVVWTGFSGYGIGAGLEDCGYGYSTEDAETRLSEVFTKAEERVS